MNIDPTQAERWRKRWSIVIECGPDTMQTPPTQRAFHYEMTQGGKVSEPRLPKKNNTYSRNARGGVRMSAAQSTFRGNLRRLIASRDLPTCLLPMRILVVQTYGGRRTKVGDRYFSGMDASATLEAVCDAVQHGKRGSPFRGLVADDAQIVERHARGEWVKGQWGLWIQLEAIRDA